MHHCCPLSITELPAVLELLCRMAPLQIPNWASSSAASKWAKRFVRRTKKAQSFGSYKHQKKVVFISQNLIYTPQIGVLSHNWGYILEFSLEPKNLGYLPPNPDYLPILGLYIPKFSLYLKMWAQFRVISQNSVYTPKNMTIPQENNVISQIWSYISYIPKITLCPKNLGYLPKLRVISSSVYTQKNRVISQN